MGRSCASFRTIGSSVIGKPSEWAAKTHPARASWWSSNRFIAWTETAPLVEIVELKGSFWRLGFWWTKLHGVGVLGRKRVAELPRIRGSPVESNCRWELSGKALGTSGAYVCGAASLRDFLVNRARSFIFSTALPATLAPRSPARRWPSSIRVKEKILCAKFKRNAQQPLPRWGACLDAIFPVVMGDEGLAMRAARQLFDDGFLVRLSATPRWRAVLPGCASR